MKKVLKVLLIVGVIVIGFGGFVFYKIMKDIPQMKALSINEVDLTNIADGTYSGKFEFSRWLSEVEVEVKDHQITEIKRLSEPLTPDVSDKLFKQMIDTQKVDIDVVSGATATSKAYMKSVEDALSQNE